MRLVPIIALCALCACGREAPPEPPPLGRFYYPSGIVHVAGPNEPGRLYVASADFDKRYAYGAVTALDLAAIPELALPSYLSTTPTFDREDKVDLIERLPVDESQRLAISPFAGLMDAYRYPDGKVRLFVPARSEGDYVFTIDAVGTQLSCPNEADGNCIPGGLSMTAQGLASRDEPKDGFVDGKPRAPEPYAATVKGDTVFITHLQRADSPVDSARNLESYVVTLNAQAPAVTPASFHPIGNSPANSVVVGERFAYLTGRIAVQPNPPALRLMDTVPEAYGVLVEAPVQQEFRILEARGAALAEDESRLFLVGRAPDTLLVVSIEDPTSPIPTLRVVRSVPLPDSPDQAALISRGPGRAPLVAVTCTGGDSVALYDDEIGQLATVIPVGDQPFGITVQRPAGVTGARLFVSNFADGQVAVIDIPNVFDPSKAKLVAKLGASQKCLTEENGAGCPEVSQ